MQRANQLSMLIVGLLAWACGPEIPPPRAVTPPPAAQLETAARPTEEAASIDYVYSPIGKRGPFDSPELEKLRKGSDEPTPDALRPLQSFELDDLKLAFTTTGASHPTAVLVDPSGRDHPVTIGDFVGKHWGQVVTIKPQEVVVDEQFINPMTHAVYHQSYAIPMTSKAERQASYELHVTGPN